MKKNVVDKESFRQLGEEEEGTVTSASDTTSTSTPESEAAVHTADSEKQLPTTSTTTTTRTYPYAGFGPLLITDVLSLNRNVEEIMPKFLGIAHQDGDTSY